MTKRRLLKKVNRLALTMSHTGRVVECSARFVSPGGGALADLGRGQALGRSGGAGVGGHARRISAQGMAP